MHAILPLIVLSALGTAPQFDVQLLDGTRVTGSLAAWNDAQITVETPTGRRELSTAKVASIAAHTAPGKPASKPAVWVELADGTELAGTGFTCEQGRAKIVLAGGDAIEVPAAELLAVRMQPESETTAAEWSRIRAKKLQGDVLVTGNQSGIDFHQGVIGDVSGDKVRFTLDDKPLSVKRAKVYGIVYYHATAAAAAESPYTIVDADGSRWVSSSLRLDGDNLEFAAPGGHSVRRALASIAQIDLSSGKIVYLSDLKPDSEKVSLSPFTATVKELPSRAQFARVRRDENAEAKPLSISSHTYRKGIAVQTRSELAWTLPAKFTRLDAMAGIDDSYRPLGDVHLQILGDGRSLFDAVVSGKSKDGTPISLDVSGIRRLVLVVESQGNFGAGDHLILGNLRLIK